MSGKSMVEGGQTSVTAGRLNAEDPEALTHPATQRGPRGDAGTQVPQDADDNDAGAQPVGPGLETQAGGGGGRTMSLS